MKKNIVLLILILLIINIVNYAQVEFPKDWKGNYFAATLYTITNASAADTSETLLVPFEVKQAIFYLNVSSVSTADTLKNMIIQGSPDGINWYTVTTFANKTSAGGERVVATLIDRYVRFIYQIAGTDPAISFNVKVTPK